MVLETLFCFF